MIHKAKKSLGQNFLKSEMALKKIIEAGEIKSGDVILEIGPGKGVLTERLLEHAGFVIAIEKDRELSEFLKIKFAKEIAEKKLILIEDDILKFEVARQGLTTYKIIANIPYNITGAILKKFLTEECQPERMILMVQHEVASRIVARDGKESILSISVKAYGEPKMIMKVPARYFSPAPKVDSAIISIKNISRKNFNSPLEEYPEGEVGAFKFPPRPDGRRDTPQEGNLEAKFWEIVRVSFAHKRKMLAGNLKPLLGNDISQKLAKIGIKENARAEDLSLKQWLAIALIEKIRPLA